MSDRYPMAEHDIDDLLPPPEDDATDDLPEPMVIPPVFTLEDDLRRMDADPGALVNDADDAPHSAELPEAGE